MATRVSMAQEIKAADRMAEWFTDIYGALCRVEPDEELRTHIETFGQTLQELEEVAERAERKSRLLSLEMQQLSAEQDAEEGRAPEAPKPRRDCSIEIVESEVGPCIRCCREVGSGLIGWRWQPETGPLCDRCLADLDLELGTVLALVQRMRELATWDEDDSYLAMDELLVLARGYAAATANAWPLRSVGVGYLLAGFLERTEEEQGRFWLSDRERDRDGEPS